MKRNHEIKIRLNDDEFNDLQSKVSLSGYSRERYIRSLIFGITPKEKPPLEYQKLIQEFNAIGNNLNQLTRNSYYQSMENEIKDVLIQLKDMIVNLDNEVRNPKV